MELQPAFDLILVMSQDQIRSAVRYSGYYYYYYYNNTYLLTHSMEQSPSSEANWFCS